jgi:hypothetical protein
MILKHPSAFVSLLALLGACATAHPHAVYPTAAAYEEEEARAIEAAKHHPIALPRERPQYPEQTPPVLARRDPAPPPPPPASDGAENASAPNAPPPPSDASAAPSASAERIVVPNPPPPYTADEPRDSAPGPGYTWAPGYWAWAADRYSWVGGDWLAPRPGYVYIGPSWAQSGYGWEFSVGGWARAGTSFVVFPVYRHPFRPYLHSYTPYYSHGLGAYGPSFYNSRRYGASNYSSGDHWGSARRLSYRDTYSAPRAYSAPSYDGRRDRQEVRLAAPAYRAREASSAPVSRAPRSEFRSPPSSSPRVTQGIRVGGGGGGGRSSSSRATVRTR